MLLQHLLNMLFLLFSSVMSGPPIPPRRKRAPQGPSKPLPVSHNTGGYDYEDQDYGQGSYSATYDGYDASSVPPVRLVKAPPDR
jgi:hypothetical protein